MEQKKLYSAKEILWSTLFFGVFAGLYLLMKNFQVLDNTKSATSVRTLIIVVAVLFGVYLIAPFELSQSISSIVGIVIAFSLYQYTVKNQGADIAAYKEKQQIHSGWKTLRVSVVALVCTVVYVLALGFVLFPLLS
ncbi:MAG: hypothetical protein RL094_272 [Candidatus Parcubacteria bacterium]|jgi:uncharacterized membrane protein